MKKVLLIPDVPNWAWDHNADGIIENLPQYEFTKMYGNEVTQKDLDNYDSILLFPWYDDNSEGEEVDISHLNTAVSAHNFHLFWLDKAKERLPKFKSIAAFSRKIKAILEEHNLNKNIYYCPCGVNEKMFYPNRRIRNKRFVVGWTGKITQESDNGYHMKGYHTLLRPIVDKLRNRKDIQFKINNRSYGNTYKFEEMPDYYNSVDLQICTSFREGTPNPIFEASACGKPVISTDVGCIPDLVKHGENGFIVPSFENAVEAKDRVDEFVKYILYLKNNRNIAEKMGYRNREIIERDWTWKTKAKNYIPIFEG